MKRFFSLLTVFMLAFALAVPVGASFDNQMLYNGVALPAVPDVKSSLSYHTIGEYKGSYSFYASDYPFYNTGSYIRSTNGSCNFIQYSLKNGEWTVAVAETYTGNFFMDVSTSNLFWANYNILHENGSTFVEESDAQPLVCDGSSCPAVDANVDGICDECAMTLRLVNPEIVLPDVTGSNLKTALFKGTFDNINGYLYSTITSATPYTIKAERLNENYRVTLSETATVQNFVSSDGKNWSRIYNTKTINFFPAPVEGVELIASDYDWVTGDGEPFFPLPLWKEMEQVTQGEMMGVAQEMGGTMKILVLSGVGLMALLVVLSLFGKRSLIFRS